jgi:hypothetical protein
VAASAKLMIPYFNHYTLIQLSLSSIITAAIHHEDVGGMDVQILVFLTLALVGGEWSASRLCCVKPHLKKEPQVRTG